ncbi:GNAT family N-acetyltransferase [Propionispora hippei]|uniref:Acetyltransferase (GNAT) family protein n=1 Tax=Propionispora hippei DSM 15287 TaxID=1123003 RepID=A0A1M6IDL8_9FIRM|nr:GNAT family N-acetyltransferase [Propionispora hippei]SHJ32503.1 Acetyltransferase (GNAT) family protein [Propionispora hippei DSM 15287]
MKFIYTDGRNQDFVKLCQLLDDYLNELAGGEANRQQYIPYNTLDAIRDVVLAYDDSSSPIGCASFKFYDNKVAEVKRVFVKSEYRGKGISKELMRLLEARAKEKGYNILLLETGASLVEAMGLYRSLGYGIMQNYGQYKDLQESICMQKNLS